MSRQTSKCDWCRKPVPKGERNEVRKALSNATADQRKVYEKTFGSVPGTLHAREFNESPTFVNVELWRQSEHAAAAM